VTYTSRSVPADCTKTVRIVAELSPNEAKTTKKSRTELNAVERYRALKSQAY
jgi:hypothetical protein